MGKNTLKYVVLFCFGVWMTGFLRSGPLGNHAFAMAFITILIPVISAGVGILCFNPSAITAEKCIKISVGMLLIPCAYVALDYNGGMAWNAIYNSAQPEIVVWGAQALLDLLRILVPAAMFVGVLQYAFFKRRLFPIRQTMGVLGVCALLAVVLSVLTQACAFRIVPSELVGDFGATIGTHFDWILAGINPLVYPLLILVLTLIADKRMDCNR